MGDALTSIFTFYFSMYSDQVGRRVLFIGGLFRNPNDTQSHSFKYIYRELKHIQDYDEKLKNS